MGNRTVMDTPRPLKWRRHERRRTKDVRRLLAAGAVVGIAMGLVAQAFVGSSVHGEIEGIVRLTLLLPGLVFIAWWLLSPGAPAELTMDDAVTPTGATADRVDYVEHVFDAAAVPGARRGQLQAPSDDVTREDYLATLRRHPQSDVPSSAFGVRRPERHAPEADTGS